MTPLLDISNWDFPKLRASFSREATAKHGDAEAEDFYDVQFYPYSPADADPVFAVSSKTHASTVRLLVSPDTALTFIEIYICRVTRECGDANPIQVQSVIRDKDPDVLDCSCCWSRDPRDETPWLCIAGEDAKIKVINALDGTLINTLVGHGGNINDLATCPTDPLLIASASHDTTVRIWNLEPAFADLPCVGILAGEGHLWHVLSAAWHSSGRYMLSGGEDHIVNMWLMPDFPPIPTYEPPFVHYPHFHTSEVHSGIIDCVAFFGDLILSRSSHEDAIVLWKIHGFDSSLEPPPVGPSKHDPVRTSRSAYVKADDPSLPMQWTRLLQFQCVGCDTFYYMRFSLFHSRGHHPMLAFCNAKGHLFFWDLQRLQAYQEWANALAYALVNGERLPAKPAWLKPSIKRKRQAHASPEKMTNPLPGVKRQLPADDPYGIAAKEGRDVAADFAEKYDMRYAHGALKPHKMEQCAGVAIGRQVAWSPDGAYCIVVGSGGTATLLQRWRTGGGWDNESSLGDFASSSKTPSVATSMTPSLFG